MTAPALEYLRPFDIPLRERTIPAVLAARALEHGDRPYLRFGDRTSTYGEVDRLSDCLAAGLGGVGVEPGDHVAVMVDNKPEVLLTYFALAKLGAVTLPVNTAARGAQLVHFLDFFDASTLVVDEGLCERFGEVAARCPKLRRLVVVGGDADGPAPATVRHGLPTTPLRPLLATRGGPGPHRARFCDVAHITTTSGTSGPSKGTVATHASLLGGAIGYAGAFGYQPTDVLYVCLPLFHANAYLSSCLAALVAGASVALSERFSASGFWPEIRRFGATQFNALGAMMNIIWSQDRRPDDADNPVRLCFAVPVPDFAPAFEARFGLTLTSCYALTDYGTAALLRPDHPPEKWQSAGQIRPDMEVLVVDDDDVEVAPGTTGEICMRGRRPWVGTLGYHGMPDATLAAWRNLWFHTGDLGHVDADGYLYFSGRRTDSIRRRGENVSAYEVEQVILTHPAVADVAAYGVRSELSEQEVMVSVVAREGARLTPEELVGHCAANMAHFMVPRYVEIVATLPRTPTQKVEKFRLEAAANARLDTVWDRQRAGIVLPR